MKEHCTKFSNEPGLRLKMQRLAREQMKERLLADIRIDMEVCRIEGWDKTEYIKELIELLEGLLVGIGGTNEKN